MSKPFGVSRRRFLQGTGLAAALIADGEARLARRGHATVWLACAIGNERAARFYRKCGWQFAGTFVSRLETSAGSYDLEVWRYEKQVRAAADQPGA